MRLIRESKYIYYLDPKPKTVNVEEGARPFRWWWIALGVAAVVVIVGVIYSIISSCGVEGTKNMTS